MNWNNVGLHISACPSHETRERPGVYFFFYCREKQFTIIQIVPMATEYSLTQTMERAPANAPCILLRRCTQIVHLNTNIDGEWLQPVPPSPPPRDLSERVKDYAFCYRRDLVNIPQVYLRLCRITHYLMSTFYLPLCLVPLPFAVHICVSVWWGALASDTVTGLSRRRHDWRIWCGMRL